MATHSSVLAWRIPGTGEPGGLPSMGSHRVGHDWSDLAAAAAAFLSCNILNFRKCISYLWSREKNIHVNVKVLGSEISFLEIFPDTG